MERLTIKYKGRYFTYYHGRRFDLYQRNHAITAMFRLASGESDADFDRAASQIEIDSPPRGTKTIVIYINEYNWSAHSFNPFFRRS
jgi:hypothetical protein